MPGYAGAGQAAGLGVNRQAFLWNVETPPASTYPGSLSAAFQVARLDNAFYPWGMSFEVTFAGNPGAFEIDILGANDDAPQNYAYLGMINAVNLYVPGYYVGRWDMPVQMWPRYIAAYLKTLTIAVPVTLKATR